jgi:hypothetical protein
LLSEGFADLAHARAGSERVAEHTSCLGNGPVAIGASGTGIKRDLLHPASITLPHVGGEGIISHLFATVGAELYCLTLGVMILAAALPKKHHRLSKTVEFSNS